MGIEKKIEQTLEDMQLLNGALQRANEGISKMQRFLPVVEGMEADDRVIQVEMIEKLEVLWTTCQYWLEQARGGL
jgi:hypothetical protein